MTSRAGSSENVTVLLERLNNGQERAFDELLALVYGELRKQARRYLRRERPDPTLQPTALVHEAFLKLVDQRDLAWKNRAHFFGIAAQAMRRILTDHARTRGRAKRGGPIPKVQLEEQHAVFDPGQVDLLALDEALTHLEALDQRQARVVELRYFAGLSVEETADVLGISPATVKREWTMARAWLFDRLSAPTDTRT